MTISAPHDDKIETLVGLVLQAVDQRLTTVREQLVDLTNTVARHHADLQEQINHCQELLAGAADPVAASEASSAEADAATVQILQAANLLTDQVTFLEARVNQYTNDRVADLRAAFEQLTTSQRTHVSTPAHADSPPPDAATAPASSASAARPAVAPVEPASSPVQTEDPAPFDIESFTAQLDRRLSALVDRAIGV